MAVHPLNQQVWVTEMGRDFLGDDLPPDEINIILEGRITAGPIVMVNACMTIRPIPPALKGVLQAHRAVVYRPPGAFRAPGPGLLPGGVAP